MKTIDLDLLLCFVTLAETKNFTEAGKRLHRSQSAISVRLHKLEQLIGHSLLKRNSRRVELTRQGEKLLPKATQLLTAGGDLLASMQAPQISGPCRIGFLEYLSPQNIPRIIKAIQRQLPQVELEVHLGLSRHLTQKLKNGELDLTLALHEDSNTDSIPLGDDQLVWVKGKDTSVPNFQKPFLLSMLEAPCFYRNAAEATLKEQGINFKVNLTANSIFAVREYIASGLGYSVLGGSSLDDSVVPIRHPKLPPLPTMKISLMGQDSRRDVFHKVLQDNLQLTKA